MLQQLETYILFTDDPGRSSLYLSDKYYSRARTGILSVVLCCSPFTIYVHTLTHSGPFEWAVKINFVIIFRHFFKMKKDKSLGHDFHTEKGIGRVVFRTGWPGEFAKKSPKV
jgi:hypothetical protein